MVGKLYTGNDVNDEMVCAHVCFSEDLQRRPACMILSYSIWITLFWNWIGYFYK